MVENTDGAFRFTLGCREILVCSGMGTGIEWRRFGQRIELSNTTNRIITVNYVFSSFWRYYIYMVYRHQCLVEECSVLVYMCSINTL